MQRKMGRAIALAHKKVLSVAWPHKRHALQAPTAKEHPQNKRFSISQEQKNETLWEIIELY